MPVYATVFVSWLKPGPEYLKYLLRKGLAPEIGLEHGGFDWPARAHREAAAMIRDQGLTAAVHLPFSGLRPGAAEPGRWRQTRDLLLRAVDIAAVYEPEHLIGHPEFRPGLDSVSSLRDPGPAPAAGRQQAGETWLSRSARAWGDVLAASPARLYLENTGDQSPSAIMALLRRLPEQAAMCLDLGHWFSAADGAVLKNLPQWLAETAPRLGHLHLHDNDGSDDQHLGLGQGRIDWGEVLELLERHRLCPTFTFEAHGRAQLEHSLNWLSRLPEPAPLKRA